MYQIWNQQESCQPVAIPREDLFLSVIPDLEQYLSQTIEVPILDNITQTLLQSCQPIPPQNNTSQFSTFVPDTTSSSRPIDSFFDQQIEAIHPLQSDSSQTDNTTREETLPLTQQTMTPFSCEPCKKFYKMKAHLVRHQNGKKCLGHKTQS